MNTQFWQGVAVGVGAGVLLAYGVALGALYWFVAAGPLDHLSETEPWETEEIEFV